MITKVSGLNVSGIPHKKLKSVPFKSEEPVKEPVNNIEKDKKNALWTSFCMVSGAIAVIVGYLTLSSLKNAKKAV